MDYTEVSPTRKAISLMKEAIFSLDRKDREETKDFIEDRKSEGWKFFVLLSQDYAWMGKTHGRMYLFAPQVSISCWKQTCFQHGKESPGPEEKRFLEWLASLNNDDFIVIEVDYLDDLDYFEEDRGNEYSPEAEGEY